MSVRVVGYRRLPKEISAIAETPLPTACARYHGRRVRYGSRPAYQTGLHLSLGSRRYDFVTHAGYAVVDKIGRQRAHSQNWHNTAIGHTSSGCRGLPETETTESGHN